VSLIPEDNSVNSGLLLGIIVMVGIGICAAGKVFLNFKKPKFVNNDDLESGTEFDTFGGTNPLAGDDDSLSELATILSLSKEERQIRDLNPKAYDELSPRQRKQYINGLRHELNP